MKSSSRIPVIIIIAATVSAVLTLALFYLRRAEPPPPSTPRPEASPSPDHRRVLDAAKKLTEKGYDLKLEGKNGEALEMFERAEATLLRARDVSGAAIASSLDDRATIYLRTGNYKKAKALYHQALGILKDHG